MKYTSAADIPLAETDSRSTNCTDNNGVNNTINNVRTADDSPEIFETTLLDKDKNEVIAKSISEMTPEEIWISKSPEIRKAEIDDLKLLGCGFPYEIAKNGDLRQPFSVSDWTYLMVIERSFPQMGEKQEFPIKIFFVKPDIIEITERSGLRSNEIPGISKDSSGYYYLYFSEAQQELKNCISGHHTGSMVKTMMQHVSKWTKEMSRLIRETTCKLGGSIQASRTPYGRHISGCTIEEDHFQKYTDGRLTKKQKANPRCKKVVLSDRAFVQIVNESKYRIETETGGLLIGHYENGTWYVVEACDPGINAVFKLAYHEGDDVYQNHVCGVISRLYKHPLVFLGMWHRHPGSLDSFSGTDDRTNYKYAESAGNGCISALVNYDPDFRITFYYVEQCPNGKVMYTRIDVEVGDEKIENKAILQLTDVKSVLAVMERRERRYE